MNNLYLENGEIFVVDAPERSVGINLDKAPFAIRESLKQALSNKIEVAEESRELVKNICDCHRCRVICNGTWVSCNKKVLKEKTLYPIENLEVEIRERWGWLDIQYATREKFKVAILTIKK
jgi:hypothetical protein